MPFSILLSDTPAYRLHSLSGAVGDYLLCDMEMGLQEEEKVDIDIVGGNLESESYI